MYTYSVHTYVCIVHSGLIRALRCEAVTIVTKVGYKMYFSEKKSISHTVNTEFSNAHK